MNSHPLGDARFDASQCEFFDKSSIDEIELGGLEDDAGESGSFGDHERDYVLPTHQNKQEDYQHHRELKLITHPKRLDIAQSSSQHASWASTNASEIKPSIFQFGSFGSTSTPTIEHGRKLDSPVSHSRGSGVRSPASSSLRPAMSSDSGRASDPYQLKDEKDFPPLSGRSLTRLERRQTKRG